MLRPRTTSHVTLRPRPLGTAALVVAAALLASCDADRPTEPTAPVRADVQHPGPTVVMFDECDPATFNEALGEGTCVRRDDGLRFDQFIAQVTRLHRAIAWRFTPNDFDATFGQTIFAVNRGGEVHTFTHVAKFGGGIVPELNMLVGTNDVAPECTDLEAEDFVPPGGVYDEKADQRGRMLFQCCIHPWMREVVRVGGGT